jgi:hypothetical protein
MIKKQTKPTEGPSVENTGSKRLGNPKWFSKLRKPGEQPAVKVPSPLKMIRENCMDCCNGSALAILWCPCDGVHSTRCPVWTFRFGKRPKTIKRKYGPYLLTPAVMPDSNISTSKLPRTATLAAEWFRNGKK